MDYTEIYAIRGMHVHVHNMKARTSTPPAPLEDHLKIRSTKTFTTPASDMASYSGNSGL